MRFTALLLCVTVTVTAMATLFVTECDASNVPSTGAQHVTLLSAAFTFGSATETLVARTGDTACAATTWQSSSSVICKSIAGGSWGAQPSSIVSVARVATTLQTSITVDEPTTSPTGKHSAANVATSGSQSVTLLGTTFDHHCVGHRLGMTTSEASMWVSSSAVPCRTASLGIPKASSDGIGAVATLARRRDRRSLHVAWTMDAPTASSLMRTNTASGAVSVTLIGRDLQFNRQQSGIARIGATAARATVWVSSTVLTSKVSAGIHKSIGAALLCTVGGPTLRTTTGVGRSATLTSALTFDILVVASPLAANVARTGASAITAIGVNMGLFDDTVKVRVGVSAAEAAMWHSVSSLQLRTPRIVRRGLPWDNNPATFTVGRATNTLTSAFTWDAPIVPVAAIAHAAGRNTPTTGSFSLSVTGMNFGFMVAMSAKVRLGLVQYGGTGAESSLWSADSAIICKTPRLAASNDGRRIGVSIGALAVTSQGTNAYQIDEASVRKVIGGHTNTATTGASSVTLSGAGFGQHEISSRAMIGGSVCATSRWRSDSAVRCKLPAGVSQGVVAAASVVAHASVVTLTTALTYASAKTVPQDATIPATGAVMVFLVGTGMSTTPGGSSSQARIAPGPSYSGGTCAMACMWSSDSSVVVKTSRGGWAHTNPLDGMVAHIATALTIQRQRSPWSRVASQYQSVCGDGWKMSGEACDDGSGVPGSIACSGCKLTRDANPWQCVSAGPVYDIAGDPAGDDAHRTDSQWQASRCTHCGDGIRLGSEECDDGGLLNGDGCDDTCKVEERFSCSGSNGLDTSDACVCSPPWYRASPGSPCDVRCDLCSGYGTCSSNGRCMCTLGRLGLQCETQLSGLSDYRSITIENVTKTLPSGGTSVTGIAPATLRLSVTRGRDRLELPSGVAPVNTKIESVALQAMPAPQYALPLVGPIRQFGPHGLRFESPGAALYFSYSVEQLPEDVVASDVVRIAEFVEETQQWNVLPVRTVDTANGLVSSQIDHFSIYAVVRISEPHGRDDGWLSHKDITIAVAVVVPFVVICAVVVFLWAKAHMRSRARSQSHKGMPQYSTGNAAMGNWDRAVVHVETPPLKQIHHADLHGAIDSHDPRIRTIVSAMGNVPVVGQYTQRGAATHDQARRVQEPTQQPTTLVPANNVRRSAGVSTLPLPLNNFRLRQMEMPAIERDRDGVEASWLEVDLADAEDPSIVQDGLQDEQRHNDLDHMPHNDNADTDANHVPWIETSVDDSETIPMQRSSGPHDYYGAPSITLSPV